MPGYLPQMPGPQLPGTAGSSQAAGAAMDYAGQALGAAVGGKKKKQAQQQQQMMTQPGMPDLMRDLGGAGFGPQATNPQAGGFYSSPWGGPGYGGGLMNHLGQAFHAMGIGFMGGGNQ